jgi:hypothetical protein
LQLQVNAGFLSYDQTYPAADRILKTRLGNAHFILANRQRQRQVSP